jgi:hypothetical protein
MRFIVLALALAILQAPATFCMNDTDLPEKPEVIKMIQALGNSVRSKHKELCKQQMEAIKMEDVDVYAQTVTKMQQANEILESYPKDDERACDTLNRLHMAFDKGANPDAYGKWLNTPLVRAVSGYDIHAMYFLLAAGADTGVKDYDGRDALAHAAGHPNGRFHADMVNLLLEAGADRTEFDTWEHPQESYYRFTQKRMKPKDIRWLENKLSQLKKNN